MSKLKVGIAVCGSFCTFSKVLTVLEELKDNYELTPILSEAAATTDTRFGKAADFQERIEAVTGKKAIVTIPQAEPIGPGGMFDVIAVAPCTGNTMAKLARGVTDTSVTMSCKAHLRNRRPLVLGISTNDALSGNAPNLGNLICRKGVYFVPFYQDDPVAKPYSLVADFGQLGETIEMAVRGEQRQPLFTRQSAEK